MNLELAKTKTHLRTELQDCLQALDYHQDMEQVLEHAKTILVLAEHAAVMARVYKEKGVYTKACI